MAGPGSPLHQHQHRHRAQWVRLLLGIFQLLLPPFSTQSATPSAQALADIPSVVELWQTEEGEVLLHTQAASEQSTDDLLVDQSSTNRPTAEALYFQPPMLDFGIQQVELPKVEEFFIHNPSWELPVTLVSGLASSRHFHMPSIHGRIIPAGEKILFRIIFLPTEEGRVESSLFINTSTHGILVYQMFGVGVPSSQVAVDDQDHFNAKPVLFPYIQKVQLTHLQENTVNCSLFELHFELSLPLHVYQNLQGFCLLSSNKLVLYVHFSHSAEGCCNELEKIKSYLLEHIFVLFIPVIAESTSGEHNIIMYILNSGTKSLYIKNFHLLSRPEDAVTVKFEPILLKSSATNLTKLASINCNANAVPLSRTNCSSEVNVIKGSLALKIFPALQLTEGYLGCDFSNEMFQVKPERGSGLWTIWFTNNFKFSIPITDIRVPAEAAHVLTLLNFPGPVTLIPGCWHVFSLQLKPGHCIALTTRLLIVTRVGFTFDLPLQFHSAQGQEKTSYGAVQCGIHCYLGAKAAVQWHQSLSLDSSSWKVDSELGLDLWHKWQKLRGAGEDRQKRFAETGLWQRLRGQYSSDLLWPRLILNPNFLLNFSATVSHNRTVKHFVLKNPSDMPVVVQILPVSHYPNPQFALKLLLKWHNLERPSISITTKEFRLIILPESKSSDGYERMELDNGTSVQVLQLTLQPQEIKKVGVEFTPISQSLVKSVILIRNNLTILDMLTVEGFGANEVLKMGGRIPGGGGSLRFKVPESSLMECRHKPKGSELNLTIRRSFKVENIGPLPVTVTSMSINGYRCHGFGFQILECQSFVLDTNSSHDVNILFTPDFTTSWVIRELQILTARGLQFQFTLNVTLPHHMLPLCADLVPALSWEQPFWMITCLFSCSLLVCVVLMAYQHAHYILTEFSQSRPRPCQTSLLLQEERTSINTLGSTTYKLSRASCKAYSDANNSPDKGKGKGALAVGAPAARSQNTPKRSPVTSSHCPRKLKCPAHYSKSKWNVTANTSSGASEEQQQSNGGPFQDAKEQHSCSGIPSFEKPHNKSCSIYPEKAPENVQNTVLECESTSFFAATEPIANGKLEACVLTEKIPTELLLDFEMPEMKGLDYCGPRQLSTPDEYHISEERFKTDESQLASFSSCEDNLQEGTVEKLSENLKIVEKLKPCIPQAKTHIPNLQNPLPPFVTRKSITVEQMMPPDNVKQKRQQEKMEGITTSNKWKGRKTYGKNRKMAVEADQTGCVLTERSQDYNQKGERVQDRPRKGWQYGKRENAKVHTKPGNLVKVMENGHCSNWKAFPGKVHSSESGSDSGSSSGSVRASRGSWGSWSSSSSEGEKDQIMATKLHFVTSAGQRERVFHQACPVYAQPFLYQDPNSWSSSRLVHPSQSAGIDTYSTCDEQPSLLPDRNTCPTFAAVAAGLKKSPGLYTTTNGECLKSIPSANSLEYHPGNGIQINPQQSAVPDYSCLPWAMFTSDYCMFTTFQENDFSSVPEGYLSMQHPFTCSEDQAAAFHDAAHTMTWNVNTTSEARWKPTNYVSSPPYISGTRSLSPMSGLFGSIWTPQSDPYQSYFTMDNSISHAVLNEDPESPCTKEQVSTFDPFGTYMNLDIWNSSSNRSCNSQLSSDSGYYGDV
ncbi:transmembrane protein 131-like [Callorhinchus milii]|uniref:transmembrane protein 131-like n=1 Tax=Callorhinchus milii TaxID=7868 RepID=UPI001C3FAC88|nr:transmembrane protein 131-like [Callorhinchus milii]